MEFKEFLNKKELNPDISIPQFYVLTIISEGLMTEELAHKYVDTIVLLQTSGYVKILDNSIELRGKGLQIFPRENCDITFQMFWDRYHQLTGLPKTDIEATKKYWSKLRSTEKKKAYDESILNAYVDLINSKKGYFYKARTYLSNKHFNDEFKVVNTDWTKTTV